MDNIEGMVEVSISHGLSTTVRGQVEVDTMLDMTVAGRFLHMLLELWFMPRPNRCCQAREGPG